MARNKFPEVSVSRILDVSLKLFLEKGYEHTTIQDIVDGLGNLSKGAIYHHFKSKEEIIDAVTTRMYLTNNPFEKAMNESGLSGLEKIKKVFLFSVLDKGQLEIYRAAPTIMKNPKFLAKAVEESIYLLAPVLQSFIEEGNQDGSVSVIHVKQAAETVMLMTNIWLNPAVFSVSKEEFMQKVLLMKTLFEGIGLPIIDQEIMPALIDYCEPVFRSAQQNLDASGIAQAS